MSNKYESALIDEFGQLDFNNFHVDLSERLLFVCGGLVDAKKNIPPSFRDRLVTYTIDEEPEINQAIVLAESFKDYFKDNTYTDLLMFEDDIASISSLVIIFLESPGSLVELGMFCSKPNYYKKLVIVAPQEKVIDEDSFIYLGPLEYIKKKDPTSVAIYPWPNSDDISYDKENISDLCEVINNKLLLAPKEEKFQPNNSGHISLLICEIITLCNPILIGEIELALEALEIDIPQKKIYRHLYLLSKVGLIKLLPYSSYRYYYSTNSDKKRIKFGQSKKKQTVDILKIKMSIRKSFVLADDSASRKRRTAQKQIESGKR